MNESKQLPYLDVIGLKVTNAKIPFVTWARIRNRLGQWRYALAYRLGPHDWPKRGMPASILEDFIAGIAKQNAKTWPDYWKPTKSKVTT